MSAFLINRGKIIEINKSIEAPIGAEVIDVNASWVVPGIIDAHCHIGMIEQDLGFEGSDGIEATDPVTPHLRTIDAINPLKKRLPLCAGLAVKEGMDMMEAIKAITINAADICNVSDRVGSIEVGKDAGIAIFDDNPMETFTNTLYTIIDRKIVYKK